MLLTITPSTSCSLITEAMSNSSGSLRSGAILTTSLGIRAPCAAEAIFLRATLTPFKRSVNAERVCSPLYVSHKRVGHSEKEGNLPQSRSVRARDINHQHISIRSKRLHTGHEVGNRIDRGRLVLAQVNCKDGTRTLGCGSVDFLRLERRNPGAQSR